MKRNDWLVSATIITTAAYPALYFLSPELDDYLLYRLLRTIIATIITIVLPGVSLTILLQAAGRIRFSFWKFIAVAGGASLVVSPTLILIEVVASGHLNRWWPFLNSLGLLGILLLMRRYSALSKKTYFELPPVPPPTAFILPIATIVLYSSITIVMTTTYYALPDFDPYYWLTVYQNHFSPSPLPELPDRPLFLTLTYVFHQGAFFDLYAFFKYGIPLLSLLVILPAWLVAQLLHSTMARLVIMTLPLASPSTILYSQTAMPQTIAIIVSYFFLFFLIYAHQTKNNYLYYLAGALITISYFYYEAIILIIIPWLMVTLISDRARIVRRIKDNPTAIALTILLVLSHSTLLTTPYHFLQHILRVSAGHLSYQQNWLFPAHYMNIDNNAMGWPGIDGVLKYYLFYVGPAILLAGAVILIQMSRSHALRNQIRKALLYKRVPSVISLVFILFFTISELLPRLFNLAFFPERAWIFAGASLSTILFYLLRDRAALTDSRLASITLTLIAVSIGGALYINTAKAYVTPDYQIEAATWVTENLPADGLLLASQRHSRLLTTYTASEITFASDDAICANAIDAQSLRHLFAQTKVMTARQASGATLVQNIDKLRQLIPHLDTQQAKQIEELFKKQIDTEIEQLKAAQRSQPLYLFVADPDPRNPYINRPYMKEEGNENCIKKAMYQHADLEQKIYQNNAGVEVWRIP